MNRGSTIRRGGRLVQAQPGTFESWSLDFNRGAFQADLFTNSLRYSLNGWDVVEVFIPTSAFDAGFVPGVTYANEGVATYKTDLMGAPGSASYGYEFSN